MQLRTEGRREGSSTIAGHTQRRAASSDLGAAVFLRWLAGSSRVLRRLSLLQGKAGRLRRCGGEGFECVWRRSGAFNGGWREAAMEAIAA